MKKIALTLAGLIALSFLIIIAVNAQIDNKIVKKAGVEISQTTSCCTQTCCKNPGECDPANCKNGKCDTANCKNGKCDFSGCKETSIVACKGKCSGSMSGPMNCNR